MKIETPTQWRKRRRKRRFVIAALASLVLLAAGISAAIYLARQNARHAIAGRSASATIAISPAVQLNLPPPDLFKPITPEEALKENAQRAFTTRPDTPAGAFKLDADQATRDRALECLTQAVYYEAAGEGLDGQRAVAQVVLNRMRHSAYPHSVCGVVYQGADRTTGCQFTFTCDGSLTRAPAQSLWKQAERVATEALAGKVFGPVGHATHYHADYVLPYWADSLDKSVQIGRHIFYRLKGGLGAASAFRQRYTGAEPLPPPPSTVQIPLDGIPDPLKPLIEPAPEDPIKVTKGELVATAEPKSELVSDETRGTLVIDSGTPIIKATRREASDASNCSKGASGTRLRPMAAKDARAQGGSDGCKP
ncbi:cell wall hydrolase [Sphingomonas daechungensis]|uniref:cell wall hydrolase n=1 Tax=Sphingomonas daechungensis TaxID=1176646 RepID=UPI003783AAD8